MSSSSRVLGSFSRSTWTSAGLTSSCSTLPGGASCASQRVSDAGMTESPAPWSKNARAPQAPEVAVGRDLRHLRAVRVDEAQDLRPQHILAVLEDELDLLLPGRREPLGGLARVVELLPEPEPERLARGRHVAVREERVDEHVDEDDRAVVVGLELLGRAVGLGDGVVHEEAGDALEVVVAADRDDEVDVGRELRICGREQREAAREREAEDADAGPVHARAQLAAPRRRS